MLYFYNVSGQREEAPLRLTAHAALSVPGKKVCSATLAPRLQLDHNGNNTSLEEIAPMKPPFALITFAAVLALSGCGHAYLEHDSQSCDRLADWNDRKACKEKAATQEAEWNRRTDAEKKKK